MGQPLNQKNPRMPRVYYVTEGFYPPAIGGQQKHAYYLAECLISKGLAFFVITRQPVPKAPDFERVGEIAIRRVPPSGQFKGKAWKAIGPLLLFIIRIVRLLWKDRDRYDIILSSGLKILPIPAVLVSWLLRKKCIVKVESSMELLEDISPESLRRMSWFERAVLLKVVRKMRALLIHRVDSFIAISGEIKEELTRLGVDPKKIQSIPNGINTKKFSPVSQEEKQRLRQQLSFPSNKVICVYTGRLSAAKGLPLLLRVWKELTLKLDDLYLLLVGSGRASVSFDACEAELNDYIRRHRLEQSVAITGEVENVQEYLQAADLFVFPTEYEGFSLALVEALACGLPTVATKVGAAGELIHAPEDGLLVEPKDQDGLRAAIEWLLQHREVLTPMGEKARKGVVDRYSIDAVANQYLRLFQSVYAARTG
jgi:glycosyltransferase involved in cell wall biosynthesis